MDADVRQQVESACGVRSSYQDAGPCARLERAVNETRARHQEEGGRGTREGTRSPARSRYPLEPNLLTYTRAVPYEWLAMGRLAFTRKRSAIKQEYRIMIQRNANKFFLGTATAIGLVTAVVMVIGHVTAEAQVGGQERAAQPPQPGDAPLQVGTYDAEQAFEAHPAKQQVEQALNTAQGQMQQAQQQGDQQQMQQIQQQFEQAREQAIQQFQQDVSRVLPNVAADVGVQVVAMEIAYKADHVKTVDITRGLAEGLAKLSGEQGEVEEAMPKMPTAPPGRKQ